MQGGIFYEYKVRSIGEIRLNQVISYAAPELAGRVITRQTSKSGSRRSRFSRFETDSKLDQQLVLLTQPSDSRDEADGKQRDCGRLRSLGQARGIVASERENVAGSVVIHHIETGRIRKDIVGGVSIHVSSGETQRCAKRGHRNTAL